MFELALVDLPGAQPDYQKPVDATKVEYVEWLEENTNLIYPALGVLALLVIVTGLVKALRTHELPHTERLEIKRAVIQELRYNINGLSLEGLARESKWPQEKLEPVLAEMLESNVIVSRVNEGGVTIYNASNAA